MRKGEKWFWVKLKLPGYGPQVLVRVCIYQRNPLKVPILAPQPNGVAKGPGNLWRASPTPCPNRIDLTRLQPAAGPPNKPHPNGKLPAWVSSRNAWRGMFRGKPSAHMQFGGSSENHALLYWLWPVLSKVGRSCPQLKRREVHTLRHTKHHTSRDRRGPLAGTSLKRFCWHNRPPKPWEEDTCTLLSKSIHPLIASLSL